MLRFHCYRYTKNGFYGSISKRAEQKKKPTDGLFFPQLTVLCYCHIKIHAVAFSPCHKQINCHCDNRIDSAILWFLFFLSPPIEHDVAGSSGRMGKNYMITYCTSVVPNANSCILEMEFFFSTRKYTQSETSCVRIKIEIFHEVTFVQNEWCSHFVYVCVLSLPNECFAKLFKNTFWDRATLNGRCFF